MNEKLKSFLGILNAIVLASLCIVFISFFYAKPVTGKVLPWVTLGGALLSMILVGLAVAFIVDFGDKEDEMGISFLAFIGGALCIAGGICTVLVSELFWIMTGIGMAGTLVMLVIGIAMSDGGFMRILSAVALTVAVPIVAFSCFASFADGGGVHLYEDGVYMGYSFTERLKSSDDANEMLVVCCAGKNVEYLNIASKVDGKPVTRIDKCSFRSYGKLKGVTIPASIKSVGKKAFKKCRKLETAVFLGTATEWCSIEFESEYSNPIYFTHALYVSDGLLTDVALDDGLEKISSYSFYNCQSIESAYIPKSVTEIGAYAFYGCSSLDSITYGGTIAEWRVIAKNEGWSAGVTARTVSCSDGAAAV